MPKSPQSKAPGAGKPKAVKPKAARPKPAAAAGEGAEGPAKAAAGMKLKDLIDRVAETTGVKKTDVKAAVSAALVEIGAALGRGDAMILPGLGRLRPVRQATSDNPVMTLKLRRGEPGKGKGKSVAPDDKDTLAEDSDQG